MGAGVGAALGVDVVSGDAALAFFFFFFFFFLGSGVGWADWSTEVPDTTEGCWAEGVDEPADWACAADAARASTQRPKRERTREDFIGENV